MTQPNKTLLKIIAILAILVVSINIFLFFGLTGVAKKFLPDIKKKTGVAVDFNRIWTTLPGGTINLSGLKVANLEGFSANDMQFLSVGKGSVNVSLLALCRGMINLSSIHVQNARLTVVKNEAGTVNSLLFQEIARILLAQKQKKQQQSQPETAKENDRFPEYPETKPVNAPAGSAVQQPWPAVPRSSIGKVRMDAVVEYIDRQISPGKAASIALALNIKADDITTFGDQGKETGSFSINGHMDRKPHAFAIDVKGTTAPVNDPHKPTFTVAGTITNICTADFKEFADAIGIESERIDLDIHIQCRNGTFVRGLCSLNAKIRKLKVTGKSAGRMQGMSIDFLSATIPLRGTVDAPDIDIIGALTANLAGNVDRVFRSINVDQKSVDKSITSFFNSILGNKKKK